MKHTQPKVPVNNSDEQLLVEPRGDGRWQLRFAGDSSDNAFGAYPSKEAAASVARANCTNVRVVEPPALPVGVPALPSHSENFRIKHLNNPMILSNP